jgi:hypothetical protein
MRVLTLRSISLFTLLAISTVSAAAQEAVWTLGTGSSATYTAGPVGIGTATPSSTAGAHVVNDSDTGDPTMLLENLGDAAGNIHLTTHRTSAGNAGIFRFKYYDSGTNLVEAGTVSGTILNISTGTRTGGLVFSTQSVAASLATEKMRIDGAGNVGIGTTSPTEKFDVAGNIHATGNIAADGAIYAKFQDVAEWVPASTDLEPGTVVTLDPSRKNGVTASSMSYDTSVAGVVSAQPGLILGEKGVGKEQIATTGRVLVRVDARIAPIRIGDLLVTSDVAGTAMRSQPAMIDGQPFHRPGTIVGKALESLDSGTGEILVLLSLQ